MSANPFDPSGSLNPFEDPRLRESYFQGNTDASFGSALQGVGPMSLFGRHLQTQRGRLQNQYQGDLVNDPYQSFLSYLNRNMPNIQSEFNNLSPYLRGEDPQRVVGRVHFLGY